MSIDFRSWDRYDYSVGFSYQTEGPPTSIPSPNWLVRFLHAFPHFKRDFSAANDTFKPESNEYRESVLFLIAVPFLWLLLTLFILLVYFCIRCCQACCRARNGKKTEDEGPKGNGKCCRNFWLITFIFVCVLFIGTGLYGNEVANDGTRQFLVSVRDLGFRAYKAKGSVRELNNNINKGEANKAIQDLFDQIDGTRAPREERKRMKDLLARMKKDLRTGQKELGKLDQHLSLEIRERESVNVYMAYTRSGEDFRWLSTAAFFSWTTFVVLLLVIGLARRSKCCLFLFAALATITLVLAWTIVSGYLGVGVGVADLCFDPKTFIRDYGGFYHESHYNRFHYLLNCSSTKTSDDEVPASDRYARAIQTVTSSLHDARLAMEDLRQRVAQYMTSGSDRRKIPPLVNAISQRMELESSSAAALGLNSLLECQSNKHLLLDALHGLCYTGLNGVSLVLLGASALGLSLTFLALIASCAWKTFGDSGNLEGLEDHENDPFLAVNNYTTGPHYMSRRYETRNDSPEPPPPPHNRARGHKSHTTVADVSLNESAGASSRGAAAAAASNPTYSEHPMGPPGSSGTPPLHSFSGSRTPPPPYGHMSSHGSHHDSIYPSAPVL